MAAFLALEPVPNSGLRLNGDTGFFNFAGQQVVNENFVTGRVDQNISDKDKLFGTYSFDNSPLRQPDGLDNVITSQNARRQIAAIEESHVFSPSFVNSLRLGYNRASTTAAAAATSQGAGVPNQTSERRADKRRRALRGVASNVEAGRAASLPGSANQVSMPLAR